MQHWQVMAKPVLGQIGVCLIKAVMPPWQKLCHHLAAPLIHMFITLTELPVIGAHRVRLCACWHIICTSSAMQAAEGRGGHAGGQVYTLQQHARIDDSFSQCLCTSPALALQLPECGVLCLTPSFRAKKLLRVSTPIVITLTVIVLHSPSN